MTRTANSLTGGSDAVSNLIGGPLVERSPRRVTFFVTVAVCAYAADDHRNRSVTPRLQHRSSARSVAQSDAESCAASGTAVNEVAGLACAV